MTEAERLAIAAHLHVALRSKTGRVTDPEWMAVNVAYAAEIVRFTRARAAETHDLDLNALASRLEFAMEPLAAAEQSRAAKKPPVPAPELATRDGPRYVGGLR